MAVADHGQVAGGSRWDRGLVVIRSRVYYEAAFQGLVTGLEQSAIGRKISG